MLDARLVDCGPSQPGVLHDVLGVGDAAEHPVGRCEQQPPMLGERVGHEYELARTRKPTWLVGEVSVQPSSRLAFAFETRMFDRAVA